MKIQHFHVYPGCGEPMECESKMENPGSPDREGGAEGGAEGMGDCEGLKGAEETDDSKKRKRKPYRPGELPRISQQTTSNIHKDVSASTKY